MRVVETPGHTRDAVSYYLPAVKTLICGEAVGTLNRDGSVRPQFLAGDRDYLESLEKLRRLDVNILVMAHLSILTGDEVQDQPGPVRPGDPGLPPEDRGGTGGGKRESAGRGREDLPRGLRRKKDHSPGEKALPHQPDRPGQDRSPRRDRRPRPPGGGEGVYPRPPGGGGGGGGGGGDALNHFSPCGAPVTLLLKKGGRRDENTGTRDPPRVSQGGGGRRCSSGLFRGRRGLFSSVNFRPGPWRRRIFISTRSPDGWLWDGKREEPYFLIVDGEIETGGSLFLQGFEGIRADPADLGFPLRGRLVRGGCPLGRLSNFRSPGQGEKKTRSRLPDLSCPGRNGDKPQGQGHYRECYPISELLDPKKNACWLWTWMGNP